MTISTEQYALLDKDSYEQRRKLDQVKLDGISYTVIDYYSNSITGYQGTAYRRDDTGEMVIANRGTEPSGGTLQDAVTDFGMVVTGFNAQLPDARAFAKRVQDTANIDALAKGKHSPSITVTGHSLGGALTEALAYENHWHGETFNGFGAVDLQYNIPEGGAQVINHVRVTDVVSAANRHFGEVRYYATQEDIETLNKAGYTNATTPTTLRNPFGAIRLSAHSINNFAPDDPTLTPSDLSPENEARARANLHGVLFWRGDVNALRGNTLSAGWQLAHKSETAHNLLWEAGKAALQGDYHKVESLADLARQRTEHNLSSAGETALNTATLYAKGLPHAAMYVDDQLREGANTAWQATEGVRHEAAQTWNKTSHAMDEATDSIKNKVTEGYNSAKATAQHAGREAAHAWNQTSHAIDATTNAIKENVTRHYNDAKGAVNEAGKDLHRALNHVSHSMDTTTDALKAKAIHSAHAAGEALDSAGQSLRDGASHAFDALNHPGSWFESKPKVNEPAHPAHGMYQQALKGVHALDASQNRQPDHRSERLAAALVVEAHRDGLQRIDHVLLSKDVTRTVAVQGELGSVLSQPSFVHTLEAVRTPVEKSSKLLDQVMQQKQHEQAHQQEQHMQHAAPQSEPSRGFSR